MDNNKDVPDKYGGFIIVLYMLFHVKNVKEHPAFNESSANNLREKYTDDQVLRICDGLKWALENRDFNYKEVFPGMRFSNEEILFFFEKTLGEMLSAGFCK